MSRDRNNHGEPESTAEALSNHPAAYSTVDAFIDPAAIERVLAPWLPNPQDRAFVVRCITDEGPVHHRGASFVLLRLLGDALAAAGGLPEGGADVAGEGEATHAPVPLRLPPHLTERSKGHPNYPLKMPLRALQGLAGGDSASASAMAECLADGPPHHALANAAMLCLIDALLRRLTARAP